MGMPDEFWTAIAKGAQGLGAFLAKVTPGELRDFFDQDKLAANLAKIPPAQLEQLLGFLRVFDVLPPPVDEVACSDGFTIVEGSCLQVQCPCGVVTCATLKPGVAPSMSCPACDRGTMILLLVADPDNPQEVWIRRMTNLATNLARSSHQGVRSVLKKLGGHLTDEAVAALRAGRVGRS